MGPGYSQMNDLVVIQASQGLCKYMETQIATCKKTGIVVGFDGRHNSQRFAELTAAVFSRGIPVHLYSRFSCTFASLLLFLFSCARGVLLSVNRMVPTPLVPFAVLALRLAGGVMITASHNPKDDNGYKVSRCFISCS